MHTVREAFVKMVTRGDGTDLATVLGIGRSENTDNEYLDALVDKEYDDDTNVDFIDVKDIKIENNLTEKSENSFNCERNKTERTLHIAEPIFKEVEPVKKKIHSFKCDQCSMAFGSKSNLNRHIPKAHNKSVECDRCKLVFAGKYNFNNHIKDCFYRCERCEFANKTEAGLEAHTRSHKLEDRKAQNYTERIIVVYK